MSSDDIRARSFFILHAFGPLFGLTVCGVLITVDPSPISVGALSVLAVVLQWLIPSLARRHLEKAAFLSVMLISGISLTGAYFFGGISSPFSPWIIVAVLLGFLYIPGAVHRWTVAIATEGLLFGLADLLWPSPTRLSAPDLGFLFMASAFTATCYVAVIAVYFGRVRKDGSKLARIARRHDDVARAARQTIAELEEDDRRAVAFMARISHELRTSLNVVVGYSELLLEEAEIDERDHDAARLWQVMTASRNLLTVIADSDRLAGPTPTVGVSLRPSNELPSTQVMGARPDLRKWRRTLSDGALPMAVFAFASGVATVAAPTVLLATIPGCLVLGGLAILLRKRMAAAPDDTPDPLTGLPRRTVVMRALDQCLSGTRAASAALLFADLDGFKEINDGLGHDVGDQLLASIAARFSSVMPDGVILARFGGDEFGAVALGDDAQLVLEAFATAIIDALVAPVQTAEHYLSVGVSIGIAFGHAGEHSGNELLRRADIAMYRAKKDKREPIQIFHAEMDEGLNFRRTMRQGLEEALSGNQLDLHLQPVVDARNGTLTSAEALLRWTHPLLGPISPAKLIALAEESGQIVAVDDWVLERALQHIKQLGDVPVAINISPVQFRRRDFARKIVDRLEAHGVSPGQLRLEITEGVLVTHTRAAGRAIAELREAGIKIALDDFGTGYSSLSYLKDFGFDFLKIDRGFIRALDDGRQGAELLRAIVDLGHSLSMRVIAEGVETAEQAGAVQLFGCDYIQGYFTGRPMPIDQFQDWQANAAVRELHSLAPHKPDIGNLGYQVSQVVK
ncbi:putative bifunctional diguanylate cyclase/phosphodiesterase [Sphingomonas immobilis]|uniref:histidine kinase n=1 Tax=Sphingomonas immobilis TaxID=3063997 RepID=A0ABT8ZW18_9SPHN|nr:EAL domain-containing protein [Sphingomonas sp. CA1-15]MDO7841769.1 EAL domain-containing protein [Sphingomonas sp. CA1-15]